MSLVMQMIGRNYPLARWESFEASDDGTCPSRKNLKTAAAAILAQLTHPKVVDLLTRDWEALPAVVRTGFTDQANREYREHSSHNKARQIKKLDQRLGGKVLNPVHRVTESTLATVDGRLIRVHRVVRSEVAGAKRAYAFGKPADYHKWPAAKKRAWQQQQMAERRERR